jgi:hypothetical protein
VKNTLAKISGLLNRVKNPWRGKWKEITQSEQKRQKSGEGLRTFSKRHKFKSQTGKRKRIGRKSTQTAKGWTLSKLGKWCKPTELRSWVNTEQNKTRKTHAKTHQNKLLKSAREK